MKSGLEGRNNEDENVVETIMKGKVSMKSGLEGRNNLPAALHQPPNSLSLNEVRPRRPEQLMSRYGLCRKILGLNEVRPRRPEQFSPYRADVLLVIYGLNEVRPRRPEQSAKRGDTPHPETAVSMKSGLEGRNNEGGPLPDIYNVTSLNEVRPRRPEQWVGYAVTVEDLMESQ